ncbi:hypothetical protein C0Z11_07530 [Acidipropionibacterium jensenii]|uniref:hypothetical protein n=1 Tax=Acidipropionibacterium jensenii TaxID=1749 RepID=UPI000BC3042F|nr:hypothetical protein [Acidipropionibacterium jensenii]AZZ42155.1 hypothetical protein C0Z11_07530 [Acidipropionibacterium jensenii]
MSVFRSTRFDDNSTLAEIRDDPDTGTRKLQRGSDPKAVAAVQNALYDLHWAQRFPQENHYPSRLRFVDGDFGPVTAASALALKTRYNIRFPPDDPRGVLDGFVGPRTLDRIDRQISHRDDMRVVIISKAGALQDADAPVRLFDEGEEPPPLTPWLGTGPYLYWWTNWDDPTGTVTGLIVAGAADDVFEVHGPILQTWWQAQGAGGPFGPATSDVEPDGSGGFRSTFVNGSISVDPSATVTVTLGPVAYQPPGDDAVFA